ncbi:MAG: alanine racemase [Treponema sp.]|nr:alanine racemase [Treponema sp.]
MRATKAIIHLDRFCRNLRMIQNKVGAGTLICAPVKADAYGHGALQVARAAIAAGARYLAVATIQEGIDLREAGIKAPILVLSLPLPEELPDLVTQRLIPLVGDREFAEAADQVATQVGTPLGVHLKIDTGMGRVGCRPEEAADLAAFINSRNSLEYQGTATHLAVADSVAAEEQDYTKKQLTRFREAVQAIKDAGIDPGIVHAANSGAVLFHEDSYFNMIRPGILLYGYAPTLEPVPALPVEPVMELTTCIVFIKEVKKGETVSYGRTWIAPKDTIIATIPVGYGDGLPRGLSGNYSVLINDQWYPLVGRICMDQCMIDLGAASVVRRWEQVTVFGAKAQSAAVIAQKLHTIPYEITCNINKRVPRVYTGNES